MIQLLKSEIIKDKMNEKDIINTTNDVKKSNINSELNNLKSDEELN